jgi:pyrroloquinoline quinone (PQQ) biosynthesis protein C
MATFFEQLMKETTPAREDFMRIPALARGATGDISLESYLAFLTEAYHHVKHTVPLLMACGSRLPERLEWLREAVGEYIEEEMGHQEWILNDIDAAGGNADAVRHGKPHASTELMVAYAYDTINRGNPVGFFGMVLVLEGTSINLALQAASAIQQSLGLRQDAFTYLNSHGALDVSHMDFYQSLVNRLDRQEDQQAIIHCANLFYRLYGDVFRALPLDDVTTRPVKVMTN